MNRLFRFLQRIYLVILFIIIEVVAISYYAKKSAYANSAITYTSNLYLGGVSDFVFRLNEYFSLQEGNEKLVNQVSKLQNQLEAYKNIATTLSDSLGLVISATTGDSLLISLDLRGKNSDGQLIDTTFTGETYTYRDVKIIGNSTFRQRNFITLDKGTKEGVKKDMSLIVDGCVVGYVVGASENFAVAISILNINFKSSGKALSSDYFGSIRWDGLFSDKVILEDVPKYANIAIGDTIITTDFSSRFPEGLKIGVIDELELQRGLNYRATVKLFTNMNNIYNGVVIENRFFTERDSLEVNHSVVE